jgi:hypothetical protein
MVIKLLLGSPGCHPVVAVTSNERIAGSYLCVNPILERHVAAVTDSRAVPSCLVIAPHQHSTQDDDDTA